MPFIKTPYLMSASQFDAFQLPYNEGGAKPPYIGAAGTYANAFQTITRDVMLQLPTTQQAGSAVFSSACFKHCVCTIGAFWGVRVNGKSLSHYLGAWYFGTDMHWPQWAPQTLPPVAAPGTSLLPAGVTSQWIEACGGFGTGLNGCGECHSRTPSRAPPLPPAYGGWQPVLAAEAAVEAGTFDKKSRHRHRTIPLLGIALVGTGAFAWLLLQSRTPGGSFTPGALLAAHSARPQSMLVEGTPLLSKKPGMQGQRGDVFRL
jgi:hypothetical protein